MKNTRNAIAWAIGSWLVRRTLKRKTSRALAGVHRAAPRRGRGVFGAFLLVAVVAGAFVAWKRLSSDGDDWDAQNEPASDPVPQATASA